MVLEAQSHDGVDVEVFEDFVTLRVSFAMDCYAFGVELDAIEVVGSVLYGFYFA